VNLLKNVRTCFWALFLVLMATSVAEAQSQLNCRGGFPVDITVNVGDGGSAVLERNGSQVEKSTTGKYTVCPSATGFVLKITPATGRVFASLSLSNEPSSMLEEQKTVNISSKVECLESGVCSYSFTAPTENVVFRAAFGYAITDNVSGILSNTHCKISGFPKKAEKNETVEIDVQCDEGYDLIPVVANVDKIIDFSYKNHSVGNSVFKFVMPAASVSITGIMAYAISKDPVENLKVTVWETDESKAAVLTHARENMNVRVTYPKEYGYKINSISYEYADDDGLQTEAITLNEISCDLYSDETCVTGTFVMPAAPITIKVARSEIKYSFMTSIDKHCKTYNPETETELLGSIRIGTENWFRVDCDEGYHFANPSLKTFVVGGAGSSVELSSAEDEGLQYYGFYMPEAAVQLSGDMSYDIKLVDAIPYEGDVFGDNPITRGSLVAVYPSVGVMGEAASLEPVAKKGNGVLVAAKSEDGAEITAITISYNNEDGSETTVDPKAFVCEKNLCQSLIEMPAAPITVNVVRKFSYSISMVRDDGASEFFIFKDDEDPEGREDDKAYEGEIISLQLLKEGKGETLSASYDTYIGSETPVTHAIDLTTAELDETGFYLIDFLMPAANVVINVVHSDIDYTISLDDVEDQCYATDFAVVANYMDNLSFQVLCQDGYYAEVSLTCGAGEECPEVTHTGSAYGFVQPATDVTVVVRAKKNVPVVEESSSSSATVVVVESSSSSATVVAVESSSSSVVVVPAESSSSKANSSSSSAKFSSSSSKAESSSSSAKSSSSSSKAESSSSSAKSSSSSSKAESSSSSAKSSSSGSKAESSSSSAKSSSSSKKDEKEFVVAQTRMPQFQMVVAGRNVALSGVRSGSTLTVFSLQGRVVMTTPINGSNFTFNLPHAGSYLVRVGSTMKQVSVR